MGLIDLKTDLKSLKYGKDKPGGGDSRQPFIKTPIPEGFYPKSGPDFLLRNGFSGITLPLICLSGIPFDLAV